MVSTNIFLLKRKKGSIVITIPTDFYIKYIVFISVSIDNFTMVIGI